MILVLDIGKTNKKALVFDEDYRLVFDNAAILPETVDEDGDVCEDLFLLTEWMYQSYASVVEKGFGIKAVNVATYGASLVHTDGRFQPVAPLYNYLKPFPDDLLEHFFGLYGEASKVSLETASPVLGNLNSGLQLYWLKHRKPLIFNQIKHSFHLQQYLAGWLQHRCFPGREGQWSG